MHALAAVGFLQGVIALSFVVICVLLILVVLLQKGRGGGLSGAFGGVGGHSAFGTKTGDVFTWVTVALTFLFILMSIIGNYVFVPPPAGGANAAALTTPGADEAETATPAGAEGEPGAGGTATQPGS